MNPFKYIKCLFVGHDVSKSKSICDTINRNNWLKKCNCCGLYVMHSNIGSITLSEKSALKIKREFNDTISLLHSVSNYPKEKIQ